MGQKAIRIIVTAGPTQEPIDPVRFISNRSTGYIGYKIAEEAFKRHHKVTLISGPTALIPPKVQKFIFIQTSEDLLKILKREVTRADCLIMASAVSDFKPEHTYHKKIKRGKALFIKFIPTNDILLELGKSRRPNLLVGFSLETENLIENSYEKLKHKHMDLIVANALTKSHNPFGNNKLDIFMIDRFKNITRIKAKNKSFIAKVLLDKIEKLWYLKEHRAESREGKGYEKKGFYAHRTPCCYCDYRHLGRNASSCNRTGTREGAQDKLYE